ncbi:MAG TPA: shikimate dehydrogenase, partial [Candidatus Methanoperedens sp.]
RTLKRAQALANDVSKAGNVRASDLHDLGSLIKDCDILINSSSTGMSPKVSDTLVTENMMHSDLVVFDIVYNPINTMLLKEARKAGAKAIDGVMMLVYQGAEAFRIWTGRIPPIDIMENAVREKLS